MAAPFPGETKPISGESANGVDEVPVLEENGDTPIDPEMPPLIDARIGGPLKAIESLHDQRAPGAGDSGSRV